jgi:hypothetical protein
MRSPREKHLDSAAVQGLRRADAGPLIAIAALQLVLYAFTVGVAADRGLIPWGGLGVYYDGNFYVEIARSFPVPYGAQALDYTSHAPGYAFLIWIAHGLGAPDWGAAALLASWVPAALASVAFWVLCRELGLAPLLPTLVFAFANPRWLQLAATPHAGSAAMLLAVLTLLAYYRGRLGRAALWLSLGTLVRYPTILCVAVVVLAVVAEERRVPWRRLLVLAWPAAALAALNLYLLLTIPDFRGVWAAHAPFWDEPLGFTIPFSVVFEEFAKHWDRAAGQILLSWGSIAVYGLAVWVGFRGPRRHWILAGWVALILLFHASLSGTHAFWEISRLAILAWPAAVLTLWLRLGERATAALIVPACAGLAACGLIFAQHNIGWAMLAQDKARSLDRLEADEPRFDNFRARKSR